MRRPQNTPNTRWTWPRAWPRPRGEAAKWAALLLAAMLLRVATLGATRGNLTADPDAYGQIAENWRLRGEFALTGPEGALAPTAFRPPLYPLALTACVFHGRVAPAAVGALHVALGVATVALVFWLAGAWGLGGARWVAAALTACSPLLLHQQSLVMTETLAAFCAAVCLLGLTAFLRRPAGRAALALGALVGLAIACRPTYAAWLPLLAACALWRGARSGRFGSSLLAAGALLLAAGATLSPWTLRNLAVLDRPIVTTTHGGYTLLLGNNPVYYEHARREGWSAPFDARRLEAWLANQSAQGRARAEVERAAEEGADNRRSRRVSGEVARDAWQADLAWRSIAAEPTLFARAAWHRLCRLWGWLPAQLAPDESPARWWARHAVAVWHAGALWLAVGGAWRVRGSLAAGPWLELLCLLAAFSALHTLYWCDLRMRAPLEPALALLAAAAVSPRRAFAPPLPAGFHVASAVGSARVDR